MPSLTEAIKQAALKLGFDVVGITLLKPGDTSPRPPQIAEPEISFCKLLLQHLSDWLAAGYHGTMEWMEKNPECRSDPRKILPGCQSIICVGINYWTDIETDNKPGMGRVARYAWGKDYHHVLKKRLKNLEEAVTEIVPESATKSYVDTGPIMEKLWAERAGLGWIGKHSNLVSPTFGSWLLLGEVLTTLELEPDEPGTDLCGTCNLCVNICPTQAITESYKVDARKCISYLTIEYRGRIDGISKELRTQMDNRIFGCDDCLDICPYNINATPTKERAFYPTPLTQSPNLIELSKITEERVAQTFEGSPLRRPKYSGFQRNIKVALENESNSS